MQQRLGMVLALLGEYDTAKQMLHEVASALGECSPSCMTLRRACSLVGWGGWYDAAQQMLHEAAPSLGELSRAAPGSAGLPSCPPRWCVHALNCMVDGQPPPPPPGMHAHPAAVVHATHAAPPAACGASPQPLHWVGKTALSLDALLLVLTAAHPPLDVQLPTWGRATQPTRKSTSCWP